MRAIAAWLPRVELISVLANYGNGFGGKLAGDVAAGAVIAIMLIPQGLAYATLAGLPPLYGLYTAIVGLLMYPVFGSSPHLAVGPTAMQSLLAAGALTLFSDAGCEDASLESVRCQRYVELALELAFLVGVAGMLLGLLRAGNVVSFLSHPVLKGFTAAAAFIIGTSQLPAVLGFRMPRRAYAWQTWGDAVVGIAEGRVHGFTLLLTLESLLLFYALHWTKTFLRSTPAAKARPALVQAVNAFPAALLVVAVNIAIVGTLHLELDGVAVVGKIQAGIPPPRLPFGPNFSSDLARLWPTAVVSALIGFMEAISVAKAMALRFGTPLDPNQELLGIGLANAAGSFFNAHPLTGAFSRTVVNADAGAKTQLAGVVSAGILAVVVVFLTGLFEFLPAATLGTMIIFAVTGLVETDTPRMLWAVDKRDLFVYAAAFLATIGLGIEQGILIGAAISLARVVQESSKPHVAELGRMPDDVMPGAWRSLARFAVAKPVQGLRVIRFDAPVYFANALNFEAAVLAVAAAKLEGETVPRAIVVDCSPVSMLDSTALHVLEALPDELRKAADARKLVREERLLALARLANAPADVVASIREAMAAPGPTADDFHPTTSFHEMRLLPHRDDDLDASSAPGLVADRLRLVHSMPPRVPLLFLACIPVPVLRVLERSDRFDCAERLRHDARQPSVWTCEYPCGCANPTDQCCVGCRPPPGGADAVDAAVAVDTERGTTARVRMTARDGAPSPHRIVVEDEEAGAKADASDDALSALRPASSVVVSRGSAREEAASASAPAPAPSTPPTLRSTRSAAVTGTDSPGRGTPPPTLTRAQSSSGVSVSREGTAAGTVGALRTCTDIDMAAGAADGAAFHASFPVLQMVLREKDIGEAVDHVAALFREHDVMPTAPAWPAFKRTRSRLAAFGQGADVDPMHPAGEPKRR